MNKFLKEFKERGYFYQCTDEKELSEFMNNNDVSAYIGFDSTAPSLHVGSLMQIMCLRLLQKYGHRPIVLLGGGTTRIGDPSGKEETRKILSEEQIKSNIESIKKVFEIFLKSDDKNLKPIFVNNNDWLGKLNYINFLRDIGKHFTINKMLSFDSVKIRLEREQSLSYMEFNYMILQAYDFLELNKKNNCSLQIGGSDQWGNIVNGVELIKRYSGKKTFGLTTPLLTTSSGTKMGKTEDGAIWLDKKMLKSYDYWQFWRNTDDKDVIRFLKMFTDIELSEIEKVKNENINTLKILLADHATTMLHGKDAADKAKETAINIFDKGIIGDEIPHFKIKDIDLERKLNIVELILITKLFKSKSDVRRAINDKGIKVNDMTLKDDKLIVNKDLFKNQKCKISFGKKKHAIIEID